MEFSPLWNKECFLGEVSLHIWALFGRDPEHVETINGGMNIDRARDAELTVDARLVGGILFLADFPSVDLAMKNLTQPSTINEIRERIKHLHPDLAGRWGKMNACQMSCHVADAFAIVVEARCGPRIKTPLPPAVIKWLALQFPRQWPQNVPTIPEINQCDGGGTFPSEWEADQQRLIRLFDAFCAKRENWPRHPIFGSMTEADWRRWGYLHTDHHLRQFGV